MKLLLTAAAALLPTGAFAAPEVDPATGLTVAPGWRLVQTHCTVCHSAHLITQQRGNARFWRETIRWMQETQNLWPLPAKDEAAIVAYLAGAYPPVSSSRRPPLAPHLLPSPRTAAEGQTDAPRPVSTPAP